MDGRREGRKEGRKGGIKNTNVENISISLDDSQECGGRDDRLVCPETSQSLSLKKTTVGGGDRAPECCPFPF